MTDADNVCGQAYALTVLTPIRDGHEIELAAHLDGLQGGDQSPLSGVPGTHFARWVVIDDVVYEGPGQGAREHLTHPRLLFTSNVDGELEPYLEGMRTGLGDAADSIWGHCIGYPGHADAVGFTAYMRRHKIDSSLFFAAYGDRTVDDVVRSLAVRRKLIDFALRAQGLSASELQRAFGEEFGA